MFKIILLSILPFILFASQINFNKKFSKKVSSDELTTRITIKLTRPDEDDISPILNKYNDLIKQSVGINKHRGNFSINPKYKYKNGNSKIVGYNGNLSYTISSKSSKNMNEFIKELLYAKDEPKLSIVISSLQWIISNNLKEEISNNLRLDAIIWAKEYTNKLSSKLNTTCITKSININQNHSFPRPSPMMSKGIRMDAVSKNIAVPIISKNKISLNVNYIMECK